MFMLLFSTTAINVVNSNERNNTPQCIPKEREALLKFKTTLNDSKGRLSSWSNNSTTQNCCKWEYITCDDQTSHVVSVDASAIDTLGGEIDSSLAELHHLKELYLSDMNISRIPKFIGSLKELTRLDLRNNPISGIIPPQLGNLTKLEYLDLSKGTSQMTIDNPRWLSQLTSLISLSLSNCRLLKVPDHTSSSSLSHSNYSFTSLQYLKISQSFIHPTTITWLLNSTINLESIRLRDNNLSGTLLHDLLGNISSYSTRNSLESLELSSNQLGGLILDDLENTFPSLTDLYLDNNQLEGHFPNRLKTFPNLKTLDISHNKFVGLLPDLSSMPNLISFKASNNKFSGTSSESIGKLDNLKSLDVSSNCLSGPRCFDFIWYDNNASITWKGAQHEYVRILGLLRVIDLSSNRLTGEIPIEVTHLSQLVALNLSRNNLFGKIPKKIGKLTNLEVLDLSHNKISGEIPIGLAEVSYLNYLDLSNNQLSGRIPTGTQLQGFNAATYAMNLGLCGTPLPSSCPGDDDDESSHVPAYNSAHDDDNDKNGGEWLDLSWFYKGIGGGFIIGFCGVCGNLLINNSWRASYFRLMQNIGDWIYVMIIIKWNFLRRKLIEH
uniref:Leucine-rich repeat-containing N-terminal plant-type domain-containing protein n=1 Tax=Cannabis sativa TaxID=3483 RepID=A0A803QA99_CANSA